jgi:hypothetical protein
VTVFVVMTDDAHQLDPQPPGCSRGLIRLSSGEIGVLRPPVQDART